MKGKTVLILMAFWFLAACSPSTPDIDVARDIDMGTVIKGTVAVAETTVSNLGTGSLSVIAISTSCGCTKAAMDLMVIPPGGKSRLRVEYDSSLHETDLGQIERYVFISSDDPDESDVQIRFTVFVEQEPS